MLGFSSFKLSLTRKQTICNTIPCPLENKKKIYCQIKLEIIYLLYVYIMTITSLQVLKRNILLYKWGHEKNNLTLEYIYVHFANVLCIFPRTMAILRIKMDTPKCGHFISRGSWFQQTWIYTIWDCFHISWSFSGQKDFWELFLKKKISMETFEPPCGPIKLQGSWLNILEFTLSENF